MECFGSALESLGSASAAFRERLIAFGSALAFGSIFGAFGKFGRVGGALRVFLERSGVFGNVLAASGNVSKRFGES